MQAYARLVSLLGHGLFYCTRPKTEIAYSVVGIAVVITHSDGEQTLVGTHVSVVSVHVE